MIKIITRPILPRACQFLPNARKISGMACFRRIDPGKRRSLKVGHLNSLSAEVRPLD
jgi:hypothetical protein